MSDELQSFRGIVNAVLLSSPFWAAVIYWLI